MNSSVSAFGLPSGILVVLAGRRALSADDNSFRLFINTQLMPFSGGTAYKGYRGTLIRLQISCHVSNGTPSRQRRRGVMAWATRPCERHVVVSKWVYNSVQIRAPVTRLDVGATNAASKGDIVPCTVSMSGACIAELRRDADAHHLKEFLLIQVTIHCESISNILLRYFVPS